MSATQLSEPPPSHVQASGLGEATPRTLCAHATGTILHPFLDEAASIPMAWVLTPLGVRGVTMHAENVSSTVYDCAIYNQTRAS